MILTNKPLIMLGTRSFVTAINPLLPIGDNKWLNVFNHYCHEIIGNHKRLVLKVPISSMSPAADFILAQLDTKLAHDKEINTRSTLIKDYKSHFQQRTNASTGVFIDDMSTDWQPDKLIYTADRAPVSLFLLDKDNIAQLENTKELMDLIRPIDQLSSKNQGKRYHTDPTVSGIIEMPIKLPGSCDIYLPSNLIHINALRSLTIHTAAAFEAINPTRFRNQWMHITIHLSSHLPPQKSQRTSGVHIDGMMGKSKQTGEVPLWPKLHAVYSSRLPTAYYNESGWEPPYRHDGTYDYEKNWFQLMNYHYKHLMSERRKLILTNQIYLVSPYLAHEATVNHFKDAIQRTFIRFGLVNTHYNGPDYTVNPRLGFFRALEDRARINFPAFDPSYPMQ